MKKFIKVLLGRKQHPNCRKVEFVYDDDGSPTISDVKDAARAQLLISLDNCDVKTRIEDNTVATLADDELYDPDDNIWIDATDKSPRTRPSPTLLNDSSPGSTLDDPETSTASENYILKHGDVTITLFKRETFDEWNTDNDASIKLLYEMAKPQTDLFLEKINLFDYFDSTLTRGLIVLFYFRNAVPNLAVYDEAKIKLQHSTTDMAFKAFANNEFTKHAREATEVLNKWLNSNVISSWSSAGSNSPLSRALRARGYRDRRTSGIRKGPTKKFKTDEISLQSEAFTSVLSTMTSSTEISTIKELYASTTSLRRSWITTLIRLSTDPESVVDDFFDKLPFLSDNFRWIHNDFKEYMEKNFDCCPDFAAVIANYAASIVSTASQQNLPQVTEGDEGLAAIEALVHLLNKYCKPKELCLLDSFLIRDTTQTNEHDLLQRKNECTNKPMIVITDDREERTYFIATNTRLIKLQHCGFAEVLQYYMELFYIFNLVYDPSPALLFEFFKLLTGINKSPKPSLQNLLTNLDFVQQTTISRNTGNF